MRERRPSMKRPGITATGRQWRTIEALRADGWLVLEADPRRWPPDAAVTDAAYEAVAAAYEAGYRKGYADARGEQT